MVPGMVSHSNLLSKANYELGGLIQLFSIWKVLTGNYINGKFESQFHSGLLITSLPVE